MKIGSLYVWLALILSVSLNGLIVFWGVKMYRSEVLAISQNAGSDSTAMEFKLAVVASSAHHEVDHNAGDHDDNGAEKDLEQLPKEEALFENVETLAKEDIQRNDKRVVDKSAENIGDIHNSDNIITVETSNPDAIFVNKPPSEEHEVFEREASENEPATKQPEETKPQENRESQENPKIQENITKQETAKSEMRTDSKSTSKPPATPKSQNPQNSQKAQSREAENARSGDQFALELAVNIHSRIEGCYPESSKRRGEEGVVFLKILNQNARLSVEIVKSSGFTRLDRCAVSAVEKILPALNAQEVPTSGITLKPIRFQLR